MSKPVLILCGNGEILCYPSTTSAAIAFDVTPATVRRWLEAAKSAPDGRHTDGHVVVLHDTDQTPNRICCITCKRLHPAAEFGAAWSCKACRSVANRRYLDTGNRREQYNARRREQRRQAKFNRAVHDHLKGLSQ